MKTNTIVKFATQSIMCATVIILIPFFILYAAAFIASVINVVM